MNSSVSCGPIPRESFPTECPGNNSFETSYNGTTGYPINARICAPQDYAVNPWSTSRDRQDLIEEVYIDFTIPLSTAARFRQVTSFGNFTIHCVGKSTRGYFELGNYYNDNIPGPLLNKCLDNITLVENFNDQAPGGGVPLQKQDPSLRAQFSSQLTSLQ
jgi:hypothetical protein